MKYIFAFIPIVAWLVAGSLKFSINYLRFGKDALAKIGNGGFPSTHTTVVSSAVMALGFNQGFDNPVFALGEAILIITMIDAIGIRRALGKHAQILNRLSLAESKLRESQGHTLIEVIGGLFLGSILGYIANIVRGW